MKKPPRCLQTFPSLPRNPAYPLQEFKVRVVQYHNSNALLDIREYVTTETAAYYSKKGLSVTLEQVEHLYLLLDDILSSMWEAKNAEVQLQDEVVSKES